MKNEMDERAWLKKLAIKLFVLCTVVFIASIIFLLVVCKVPIRIIAISGPISLVLVYALPALMYFWKGPIR